ncbi:MAG: SDR family NAD(P)-dependent oxidoreductase, partial [Reyranellaceae bacterium]
MSLDLKIRGSIGAQRALTPGLQVDEETMAGKRFEGRVAVVTGGARGIGADAADLFAEGGASVVLLDLDKSV